MTDIEPCRWCKSVKTLVDYTSIKFQTLQVSCEDCQACGPIASTRKEAIAAWNAGPRAVWHPIATAPRDRMILVYAVTPDRAKPPLGCDDLEPLICTTKWHTDAGFCVCELREATHWAELPKGPGK